MENIEDYLKLEEESIVRRPFKVPGTDIEIKPITVSQYMQINPYLIKIEKGDLDKLAEDIDSKKPSIGFEYMGKYMETIKQIADIITGKDTSDLTPDNLMLIFVAIVYRTQRKSFMRSINYLRMLSLQRKTEIIAVEKRFSTSTD